MAITINATLVVQGINFCITYFLLRRYLFKPSIVIIDREAAQQEALNAAIQSRQKAIDATMQEQRDQWRDFHRSIQGKIPATGATKLHRMQRIELILEPQTMKPERLALLTDEAVASLVKRVEHV